MISMKSAYEHALEFNIKVAMKAPIKGPPLLSVPLVAGRRLRPGAWIWSNTGKTFVFLHNNIGNLP